MTRKVTASCLRTRLLLLPTLANRWPPVHPQTHPLRHWQQPRNAAPRLLVLCPYAHSLPTRLDRFPKKHAPCISSQRTVLCCVQSLLTIEKGKNVLPVRVLSRSRALNRIVYLHPDAWHSRVDTKTGCSIACPDGTCQGVHAFLLFCFFLKTAYTPGHLAFIQRRPAARYL